MRNKWLLVLLCLFLCGCAAANSQGEIPAAVPVMAETPEPTVLPTPTPTATPTPTPEPTPAPEKLLLQAMTIEEKTA